MCFTLNRGIDSACGEYVFLSAADDEILPGFLEKSLRLLAQHHQAGLSCTVGDWREEATGLNWHAGVGMTAKQESKERAEQEADRVVNFLSNVEEHITHGRLILARELKKNCAPPLEVVELPEPDETWQLLWELYVRWEVFLMSNPPKAKLIETADVSITLS